MENLCAQTPEWSILHPVKFLGHPPVQREIADLVEQMQSSPWEERKLSLAKLIRLDAQDELTACLTSDDPLTAQLATAGLWECWLNEQGPEARHVIDWGIDLLQDGQLYSAEKLFRDLSAEFPGWAEPVHKRGEILALLCSHQHSLELFQWVVEIKPNHFAALHNLALSALQLQDWELALSAAEECLRVHARYNPNANREIIREAKAWLDLTD